MGSVVGLLAAMAIPFWLDRAVWLEYVPTLEKADADSIFIPTLSSMLRLAIKPQAHWLQFLPVLLTCVWGLWYFVRHKANWDWNREGLLLLLISLWAAPYSWFSDEIVVLPAMMAANYRRAEQGKSLGLFIFLNAVALLLVIFGAELSSGAFVWTTTAWLSWYLFAMRSNVSQALPAPDVLRAAASV